MGDSKFKILNASSIEFGNHIYYDIASIMEWKVLSIVMKNMAENPVWISDASDILAPWSEFK